MEKKVQYFYKRRQYLLLCALFMLMPGVLSAQRDTSKKLHPVDVSTSRLPQIQTITPSQQVTAAEFDRYNAINVADAIRDFAGVIIKDYGGIGGLKTISVRGLGANHTAIIYDGVQINDAENGQVDLGKFNLNNVQQITLYNGQPPIICQPARSFAAASVLSIVTLKPNLTIDKPYSITAGINAGSFGLVNPYLQWQQRLSNNWSFVINSYTENANSRYKYLSNDGSANNEQTRIGSAISAQQIDGSLYWAKSDSNKFNFHINYYNSDRGLPGAVILFTAPPNGQRLWNQDFFSQGGYEYVSKSGFHLLINSKLSQNFLHYLDPQFPNAAHLLDQHFIQREFYQSVALAYHLTQNWEVSYASDLSLNNMDADGLSNFHFPTRISLLNVLATNLIIGKVTLQASLLNTNITEKVREGTTVPSRNAFSPTLMATVKPFTDQNIQLRGFYKSIFRLPTFNELYYGFVTNTALKPESADEYDLGFTYNKSLNGFFDYIAITTDAYYNHVTNKIVYIPTLYSGSSQNFGKVDIKGLDFGLKTQTNLFSGYKAVLAVNYSYQQALNVTDPTSAVYLNQLPYIPENTVALNAGISKGKLGIYYNQVISSYRYYNNNNESADFLPSYSVSDVSMVYKSSVQKHPVTLSAGINNLFNKSYVVVQSYPMPGRSFRFSFQINI